MPDLTAATPRKAVKLPVYWENELPLAFMKEAQKRDPDYRHRWIQVSAKNQQIKRYKGWEPVEDRETIARLGFDTILINARNRVQWGDVELWRMPREVADAIRAHINAKTQRRLNVVREGYKALAEEVIGRSRGTVAPFLSGGTEDVFDRNPPEPSQRKR